MEGGDPTVGASLTTPDLSLCGKGREEVRQNSKYASLQNIQKADDGPDDHINQHGGDITHYSIDEQPHRRDGHKGEVKTHECSRTMAWYRQHAQHLLRTGGTLTTSRFDQQWNDLSRSHQNQEIRTGFVDGEASL